MTFLTAIALMIATDTGRWSEIGRDGHADREFLDRESIRRQGARVTLWTRRDSASGQRSLWHEIEIDCVARQHTILAFVQDDAGEVSHNDSRPHRGPVPIAASSPEEKVFEIACR